MSFDFNNINPMKAQGAYKDGGGMGGGGMYMRQRKKRKDEEKDLFEKSEEEKDPNEIDFIDDDEPIQEKEIPQGTKFNRFVNWFRINN